MENFASVIPDIFPSVRKLHLRFTNCEAFAAEAREFITNLAFHSRDELWGDQLESLTIYMDGFTGVSAFGDQLSMLLI